MTEKMQKRANASFNREKEDLMGIARELGYSRRVLHRLEMCNSSIELQNAMAQARKDSSETGEWCSEEV